MLIVFPYICFFVDGSKQKKHRLFGIGAFVLRSLKDLNLGPSD